ncbi:MAG: Uncharacterised protein [Cryomorphaceae bacterium]|nr:MAG: Uncharacterised protein [Cryomorphaceae bacterium]
MVNMRFSSTVTTASLLLRMPIETKIPNSRWRSATIMMTVPRSTNEMMTYKMVTKI